MKIGQAFVAAIVFLGVARAQTPEFEVASVKPSAPLGPQALGRITPVVIRGGPGSSDPGLVRFDYIDMYSLVTMAYGIQWIQLSGPDWLRSTRFDINAKVPRGATREQYRLMLQNLLAERFKLVLHHETKEATTYDLVVAKNGPKLKQSEPEPDAPNLGLQPPPPTPPIRGYNGAVQVHQIRQTTERLAATVASQLGVPVTDNTGLKGIYDISLHWSGTGVNLPASDAPDDTAVESQPTLLQAVQEQLGLKLVPRKGQIDVLVIDHIEKVPTEN
jgi:uncharacterized protein (TIGR03435 family)